MHQQVDRKHLDRAETPVALRPGQVDLVGLGPRIELDAEPPPELPPGAQLECDGAVHLVARRIRAVGRTGHQRARHEVPGRLVARRMGNAWQKQHHGSKRRNNEPAHAILAEQGADHHAASEKQARARSARPHGMRCSRPEGAQAAPHRGASRREPPPAAAAVPHARARPAVAGRRFLDEPACARPRVPPPCQLSQYAGGSAAAPARISTAAGRRIAQRPSPPIDGCGLR